VKKTAFLALAVAALVAGAFLLQCDLGAVADSGGAGADFNPNDYYLRSEVDQKFSDSKEVFYANETTATFDNTKVGYANGASWTIPDRCSMIIFQVEARNLSGSERHITFAYTNDTDTPGNPFSFTLNIGETLSTQFILRLNSPTPTDKLWINGPYSDMSGVTINVLPIFWLKNTTG
jgi:hypothetical protein